MTVLPGALPVALFPQQLSAYFAIDIFMTAATECGGNRASNLSPGGFFTRVTSALETPAVTNGSGIPGDSNWKRV